MEKAVLLLLMLIFAGCGQQSKPSFADNNLLLARKFLAIASSNEKRDLASDLADETFEFRWMGLLPDENGNLVPGMVLNKQGQFSEHWE